MARQATPDLLGDVSQETTDVVATVMGTSRAGMYYAGTSILVRLDLLRDNPYQPRQTYTGIEELAENIRLNGLLQPPVARSVKGHYELAFGHRRLRAYHHLASQYGQDWDRMPIIVRQLSDDEMARNAWSENHNREDVSAVEEARLFQRMMNDFGLTQQEIADDIGKSRSAVANTLRLLQLPAEAQAMIDAGEITERHGRELLRLIGAPTWLHVQLSQLLDDKKRGVDVRTVSQFKREIDNFIRINGILMPLEPITVPNQYGNNVKHNPPTWGWEYAPKSPDVIGPCRNCHQSVHFGGDPAPRCTNSKCYQTKDRIWTDHERERQRAAALAAANVAPVTPAPAAHAVEARAAPRTMEKIENASYGIYTFRTGDPTAPLELIKHGLCGKDQCHCFCLTRLDRYQTSVSQREQYARPDPENAPDIVYACSSGITLAARRRRLEAIVEPDKAQAKNERRAQLSKQTRDTKELLREFWAEIGPNGLMRSPTFVSELLIRMSPYANDGYKSSSLADLWDKLFWILAKNACQKSEWLDNDRVDRWHMDLAEKWTAKIYSEIGEIGAGGGLPTARAAHQPGPGDSQLTNWQEGWDDEDETTWRDSWKNGFFAQGNPDAITRPRVLLRAIETSDEKTVRGALWRRYNQLQAEETDHA